MESGELNELNGLINSISFALAFWLFLGSLHKVSLQAAHGGICVMNFYFCVADHCVFKVMKGCGGRQQITNRRSCSMLHDMCSSLLFHARCPALAPLSFFICWSDERNL